MYFKKFSYRDRLLKNTAHNASQPTAITCHPMDDFFFFFK